MSVGAALVLPRGSEFAAELRQTLHRHAGYAVVVLIHAMLTIAIGAKVGAAQFVSLWLYGSLFSTSTLIIITAFMIWRSLVVMWRRPDRLALAILNDLLRWLDLRRLLNGAPMVLLLSVFNSSFTSLKAMIPLLHPYNWDATLMQWDRVVHGGIAPWQALQPLLGFPLLTGLINLFYNLWFFALAGCWLWQAFSLRNPRLRMQFFLTYLLCFALLGNLAAVLFASGGPCFYVQLVTGPNPYAPLMDYLHQAAARIPLVWSTAVQDLLWQRYATGAFGIGSGISAMPSMHLAGATLMALLGWRTGRLAGSLATAFAALIMIGSVHLGWHYAVDGYAAILGTAALWWAVGRAVGADGHRTAGENQPGQ
jgi:hypothetical protein